MCLKYCAFHEKARRSRSAAHWAKWSSQTWRSGVSYNFPRDLMLQSCHLSPPPNRSGMGWSDGHRWPRPLRKGAWSPWKSPRCARSGVPNSLCGRWAELIIFLAAQKRHPMWLDPIQKHGLDWGCWKKWGWFWISNSIANLTKVPKSTSRMVIFSFPSPDRRREDFSWQQTQGRMVYCYG